MRPEKQLAVEEFKQRLDESRSVIFTGFSGLSAEQMNQLRGTLQECSASYMIVKNRLFKIAVDQMEMGAISEFLNGPVGVVFGPESYSELLKELVKFGKENNALALLGGYIEEQAFGPDQVKKIAGLPSKPRLQAILLAALQTPISGFVGVLHQRLASVVRVLSAIAGKKEENSE